MAPGDLISTLVGEAVAIAIVGIVAMVVIAYFRSKGGSE